MRRVVMARVAIARIAIVRLAMVAMTVRLVSLGGVFFMTALAMLAACA
ncbi:MAG: hypothetical protein OIF57_03100 [Marinobacterium sp.]|nr:hypothetical protein [Marinobacterium sp.]